MPCRDEPTPREIAEANRVRQERLDKLTRLLCGATERLMDEGLLFTGSELHSWYLEHQEADRRREAEERARKEASDNRKIDAVAQAISALPDELRYSLLERLQKENDGDV